MGTRRIDARIPVELYREIRKRDVGVSRVVCDALNSYLHTDGTQSSHDEYTRHLLSEIVFLRDLNSKMSARVFLLPENVSGLHRNDADEPSRVVDIPTPKEKKRWWARFKHG